METIALFGAAGKIGMRIASKLRDDPAYRTLYVEAGEAGEARLRAAGLVPSTPQQAADEADIVVLAIPDTLIGRVAADLVPRLRPGTLVMVLDPAAPYGGELPARPGVAYVVVHPCHPPLVSDETDPAARADFFGGVAGQHIVCALMQGDEADYRRGEQAARHMFAPVLEAHRVTVEQMAILEPAMAETVILTLMVAIKEAVDEAVRRGVPAAAAQAFAMGHMRVNVGILFGYIDAEVSAGAKLAVERAREILLRPDWKRVFEPENVLEQVKAITQGRQR